MNLAQLAEQYRNEADVIQHRIGKLQVQIKTARGPLVFSLQKRIDTLYDELLDLRWVMGHLRNYYAS